jgi:hypothetical protein
LVDLVFFSPSSRNKAERALVGAKNEDPVIEKVSTGGGMADWSGFGAKTLVAVLAGAFFFFFLVAS